VPDDADVSAMPRLKPGTRLRSAVCTTELMVIRAPDGETTVTCGGAPLLPFDAAPPGGAAAPAPDAAGGTQIGKRYVDASGQLELLCTRAGGGSLSADGVALVVKGAKPLPSSD
jgi:hypothetical protein